MPIDRLKRGHVIFNGVEYEVAGGHLVNETIDLIPLNDKRRRIKNISWQLVTYVEDLLKAQEEEK